MPVGDGIIEFWEQCYLQIFGLMMIERGDFGKGAKQQDWRVVSEGRAGEPFKALVLITKF